MSKDWLVRLSVVVALIGVAAIHTAAAPSPSTSSLLAHSLSELLTTNKLDAIAVRDTSESGRFVAALLVPGSQLLVVTALHPSVAALDQRVTLRNYRDVYLDLQGTPTPAGKYFVQDSGADGIQDDAPTGVDVAYEDGARQIIFSRKLSSLRGSAYETALAAADKRYAQMLTVLVDAVRRSAPAATH
jgi:hypothetical protein